MTSSNEPNGRDDVPPPADPLRALAARLLLMVPLVIGTVLTEAIFAAAGAAKSDIALGAAVVAFLLCWQGVAWALRSWVAVLLTFVPAVMITLGAAMIASVEPIGGTILLVVGGTLLLAVVWVRVAAPLHRWTPGWTASGGVDMAGIADPDDPSAWRFGGDVADPGRAAGTAGGTPSGPIPGVGHRAGPMNRPGPAGSREPGFGAAGFDSAAFDLRGLRPDSVGPAERPAGSGQRVGAGTGRRPPPWDTSGTDLAARDALVLALCQRGGAAGPTVATLEEFFTGNGDPGSIAPPLRGAVPLSTFATVLHTLRSRPDVAEVLVQVEPLGAGRYPAGSWPAAGSIRVVGAVDADVLDAAVAPLRAAPALGPLPTDELADGRPAPAGASEYAVWWA